MGFQVDPVDPDVMVKGSGGGGAAVFGLVVLAAGLALVVLFAGYPLGGLRLARLPAGMLFGGVLVLIGGIAILGRKTVIIDRRRMMLVRRLSFLATVSQKEIPLGADSEVTITREIRRTKNSTYTVYPVHIKHNVSDTIGMEETREYEDARRLAESFARFLRIRLADSSTGTLVVREGDQVDESVRSQVRRTGEEIALPQAPREMKSQVKQEGQGVVLEIPLSDSSYAALAQKIIFWVFLGFILFPLGTSFSRLFSFQTIWIYVAAAVVIFFVARSMRQRLSTARSKEPARSRVTANRQVFRFEEDVRQGAAQAEEIPTEEIEELQLVETEPFELEELPDGGARIKGGPEEAASGRPETLLGLKGKEVGPKTAALLARLKATSGSAARIVVRSDKKTIEFGMGLSKEELRYLHALVKRALTS